MRDAIYIAGPTASGKSEVALALAEEIGGEIISVDSMQVYRGLDIGTAKPSAEERARVPHHLIDVCEVTEAFDAARFVELAKQAEAQIRIRGGVPIYCGGTGLYFKALIAGLGGIPKADPELRRALEAIPLPELLEELKVKDPEMFARIDRENPRRVIRAIEVMRLTRVKYSAQRTNWESAKQTGCWFGLERDRHDLLARIDRRVDEMFERGLIAETRQLVQKGLAENRTATQSLGYRQVIEHLRGTLDLQQTVALVKTRTRQFAKRQMTWFRGQLNLQWMKVPHDAKPKVLVGTIVKALDEYCSSAPRCS